LFLTPDLFLELGEIILESGRVRGYDLVHLDDFVIGLSDHEVFDLVLTAIIISGFDRLGDLALLQVLDGPVVIRLELVNLEI